MREETPPVAPSRPVRQGSHAVSKTAGAGANPAEPLVPASLGRRRTLVRVQLSRPVGHSSRGEHGAVNPGMRVRVPLATPPARGETDDHGSLRSCSRRFESSRAGQMRTELESRATGCLPEGCGCESRRPRQCVRCEGEALGHPMSQGRKGGRAAEGTRLESGIPLRGRESGPAAAGANLTPSRHRTTRPAPSQSPIPRLCPGHDERRPFFDGSVAEWLIAPGRCQRYGARHESVDNFGRVAQRQRQPAQNRPGAGPNPAAATDRTARSPVSTSRSTRRATS